MLKDKKKITTVAQGADEIFGVEEFTIFNRKSPHGGLITILVNTLLEGNITRCNSFYLKN